VGNHDERIAAALLFERVDQDRFELQTVTCGVGDRLLLRQPALVQ